MNNGIFYNERNIRERGMAVTNPMPRLDEVGRIGRLTGYHMRMNDIVGELQSLSFSEEDMACGVLFLGSAGCGKTNVINRLMYDVLSSMTADDVAIIYDVKREFTEHFYINGDIVISPDSYTDIWNIYNDILEFSVNEGIGSIEIEQVRMRSTELVSRLFEGQRSEMNPFFVNAAVMTVSGVIELDILEALTDPDAARRLNNRSLRERLGAMDKNDYYKRFSGAGSRFAAHAKLFAEHGDDEGRGIVTEIVTMVGRQFVGSFGEAGEFSVANVIRERGGRVVFLQNDISLGGTLSAVLSAFYDMAISYAARPNAMPRGRVFLFLDELATLSSKQLELALTLLRSQRVCMIGGLQNISRLRMNSPTAPDRAEALLEAFQNVIAMSCTSDTREYLKKRFGKTRVMERYDSSSGKLELRPTERYVVEDYEFEELRIGDAFCQLRGQAVFKYHFDRYIFR